MKSVITNCHEFLNILKILVYYFKFHKIPSVGIKSLFTIRNTVDINSSGSYICANQEPYVSFLQRTKRTERHLSAHMQKNKHNTVFPLIENSSNY